MKQSELDAIKARREEWVPGGYANKPLSQQDASRLVTHLTEDIPRLVEGVEKLRRLLDHAISALKFSNEESWALGQLGHEKPSCLCKICAEIRKALGETNG